MSTPVKYKVYNIEWVSPRKGLPKATVVEIDVCPGFWETDAECRQEIIDGIGEELDAKYGDAYTFCFKAID
jgi:hypothetical protein